MLTYTALSSAQGSFRQASSRLWVPTFTSQQTDPTCTLRQDGASQMRALPVPRQ